MKVAYLGPAASFTHMASEKAFPNAELIPSVTIPDCIKALEDGTVESAIVPIENTIEGTVNVTLDYLFHQANIPIQAELVLPIAQHLMVHPDNVSKWREAEKVLSHPQALAQCETYLSDELDKAIREATPSTAYAARRVGEQVEPVLAAIAPRLSAKEYGLTIVAEDIQELELNQTRFLVLSHQPVKIELPSTKEKISISVTLPNNMPGALHKVLAAFSWRQIDLCKIESRPLKTTLGEYFFLIDLYVGDQEKLIDNAIEEIQLTGCKTKTFGRYSVHTIPIS
ncbi:MAG: prephenate dehydratase [Carnobacterium sp.]|uniref:prephenate dehydratase n=1 Tax=Carnobacterium TaxID=2747 RepID=UPI00257DA555|nr:MULTISPECIES: prephenate dehydratase [Carnobacterium]MBQ6485809.1 prephenate dehydratase [Carnobacterium sp.]